VTACGEDADSANDKPNAAALKGKPIKFSVLYPATGAQAAPSLLSGAEAAARAVNDAGGVKLVSGGEARPIELVPCDADNTKNPSQPADCARSSIDAGVVLDVAKYTLAGDEVDVFGTAGVAMLGTSPFSQQDLTNPMVFPIGGAVASLVPGTAAALQASGAKKIAYLSLDIPAAHAAAGFMTPILGKPSDLIDTVLLPVDQSADIAPFLAKLADKEPDGIILGVPGGMMAQVVTGLRQAGYKGKFVATPYTLPANTIKALGADADGMLSVSDFGSPVNTDNAAMDRYNDEMDEYAADSDRDEYSLAAWAAVHLAADIAGTLSTIDAPTFAKALEGRQVDIGIAPPFTLGKKDIFLPFPRVFRGTVQYQEIKDGRIVATGDGEFVDLNSLVKR
jgi:ABC-type branched-subunit amino acid transport system substrate-binding protein